MRLADFIDANLEPILTEWEAFAREMNCGASMDALALRDHAGAILSGTVRDMRSVQSAAERSAKSRGHQGGENEGALNGASERHGIERLGAGFNLLEVVSEYRALRASVLRQWNDQRLTSHVSDLDDVTRFNESIDQSLGKAVSSYTQRVDQSRDLFLAILSHDLRNPLNLISMSASLLTALAPADTQGIDLASQISTNASVMARMISDLLDYTRTRLGSGMPVSPQRMDLGALCQELESEFRIAHPNRPLQFVLQGNLHGSWDADRLRQAISNLLGNAIQHSPETAPLKLHVRGEDSDVVIVVYNGGPAIPAGELTRIFDPLVQGTSAEQPLINPAGSIGLGLYIVRAISESHGGSIDVMSSEADGTSFTMRLPRDPVICTKQLTSAQ